MLAVWRGSLSMNLCGNGRSDTGAPHGFDADQLPRQHDRITYTCRQVYGKLSGRGQGALGHSSTCGRTNTQTPNTRYRPAPSDISERESMTDNQSAVLAIALFIVGLIVGGLVMADVVNTAWQEHAESGQCRELGGKYYEVKEVDAMINNDGQWYPARRR